MTTYHFRFPHKGGPYLLVEHPKVVFDPLCAFDFWLLCEASENPMLFFPPNTLCHRCACAFADPEHRTPPKSQHDSLQAVRHRHPPNYKSRRSAPLFEHATSRRQLLERTLRPLSLIQSRLDPRTDRTRNRPQCRNYPQTHPRCSQTTNRQSRL